jgi:hypothetical protein
MRGDAPLLCAWYATEHHPLGASAAPSYDVVGSMVYPGAGHPSGAAARPWFQLRDALAYPVDGHPGGPSNEPALRVAAGWVYPARVDPLLSCDTRAWFEVRAEGR